MSGARANWRHLKLAFAGWLHAVADGIEISDHTAATQSLPTGHEPPPEPDISIVLPMRWGVREDGNTVILEITCRDNYEAIELAEALAQGVGEGSITMEFENSLGKTANAR